ncbi:MAG: hypothetical protein R3F61_32935 [Myxococcota bacterium]
MASRSRTLAKVLGATSLLGVLLGLATIALIARPHLWLYDQYMLSTLESGLLTEVPNAKRVWSERHQTGSCCATLYGIALVEPTSAAPPPDIERFHVLGDEILIDDGTLECGRFEPMMGCTPRSIDQALVDHPGLEAWVRTTDAAWFD